MIWLLETKERCVYGFASEAEGVARAADGEVAAGLWQFFDAEGGALVPSFTTPHGYRLEPAPPGAARLQDILHELRAVVIDGRRLTATALRERLPPVVPG